MCNNGGILPQEGYLTGVRDLTKKYDVLLMFDEVITGFRLALGGAQEYFNADLCVFTKAVSAGYPVSGFGGRRDIMELVATNEVPQYGTYNTTPFSLAVVVATLQELSKDNDKALRHVSEIGAKIRAGLSNLFQKYDFSMKTEGFDTCFVLVSPVVELRNYRDVLKLDFNVIHHFHAEMMSRGVLYMQRDNIMTSATHMEEDVAQTLEAAEQVIRSW